MAKKQSRKLTKTGVKIGGGPPPGYQWNIEILDQAYDEATAFLNVDQYQHLSRQVRELAKQEDPSRSETVDVRSIKNEEFHEIRDKWGILNRLNVRIFFAVHKSERTIFVLGVVNKQNDGPTLDSDRILMRRRRRLLFEAIEAR